MSHERPGSLRSEVNFSDIEDLILVIRGFSMRTALEVFARNTGDHERLAAALVLLEDESLEESFRTILQEFTDRFTIVRI